MSADLDTINSTQLQAVQYLGLIYQALSKAAITLVPVPTSSAAVGTAGQVACDTNYLYLCVATNTWRRVALSTF